MGTRARAKGKRRGEEGEERFKEREGRKGARERDGVTSSNNVGMPQQKLNKIPTTSCKQASQLLP